MKQILMAKILASALTIGFNSFQADFAYGFNEVDTIFLCESINGIPTTVARIQQRSEPIEIVRWRSSSWFDDLYPPEKRCQEVAGRLQIYYSCGFLREFTSSANELQSPFFIEKSTVAWTSELFPILYVKVSSQWGDSRCASQRPADGKLLLFMLEPDADTSEIVNRLEEIRRGFGDPVVAGSGEDMDELQVEQIGDAVDKAPETQ